VIPASVPLDRRKMLYARLMVAYATKETVKSATTIRATGGRYIHVHRRGVGPNTHARAAIRDAYPPPRPIGVNACAARLSPT